MCVCVWEGGGAVGVGVELPRYGILRMCVPNAPFFSAARYMIGPLFSTKKYMTDPIFPHWYMKGSTFSDIPIYAHFFFFTQRLLTLLVLLVFNDLTAIFV